jgi:rhodanese-related sulfurtransferase
MLSQVFTIGVATLMLALLGQAAFGDLRHHFQGVAVASAPFRAGAITHGSLSDARRASQTPGYLLIDARYEQDFRAGTIPNAVNVPVYASVWSIRQYFRNVDRQTPVVVFCQSKMCEFDETVAQNMSLIGFEHVLVCDEGWHEYSSQRH